MDNLVMSALELSLKKKKKSSQNETKSLPQQQPQGLISLTPSIL